MSQLSWLRPAALDLPDADVRYLPSAVPQPERWYARLVSGVPWQQDHLTLFGQTHPVPRLHQWFAPPGVRYRWSGLAMEPAAWTDDLRALQGIAEQVAGCELPTALVNYYRSGEDTVGWHADDEPILGPEPVIVSLSLGATRDFRLRHRRRRDLPPVTVALGSGSALVMRGATQQNWEHCLPRRKRVSEGRVNLTFRSLVG